MNPGINPFPPVVLAISPGEAVTIVTPHDYVTIEVGPDGDSIVRIVGHHENGPAVRGPDRKFTDRDAASEQ